MNILITSVGRRSYMVDYFKEALGGEGEIHVANSSAATPAFARADRHVVTPLIYSEEYIPFLLAYCREQEIAAIVSLFDIDLLVLARHREKFCRAGVRLILSDEGVIEKCNDKWKSFQYLRGQGFLVPETWISLETVLEEIKKGEVCFPLMVKPRWGMGSISVMEAENERELQILYEKIRRDVFQSYLKYESAQNPEECVLIQEKLAGQEYGLDVINDLQGKYVTTVVKRKYAMRAGETDCAVTVENREMKALGRKLGCRMGHVGNLDVDVFQQNDGMYILEMNARFGGGYPFSHVAGVDLPLAIVRWLRGEEAGGEVFAARENVLSYKDIGIAVAQVDGMDVSRKRGEMSMDELVYEQLRESKYPVYIWGIGALSIEVTKRLRENGIGIAGYFVDVAVADGKSGYGVKMEEGEVRTLEELEGQCQKIDVVLGHGHYERGDLMQGKEFVHQVYMIGEPYLQYRIDRGAACLARGREELESISGFLADEASRNALKAYYNFKATNDLKYLLQGDFFIDGIFELPELHFGKQESYLDVGAWEGDTMEGFLEKTAGEYQYICGIEPEAENFRILERKCRGWRDAEVFRIGVGNQEGSVFICNDNKQSAYLSNEAKDGGEMVEVKRLDDFLPDKKFSIIKISVAFAFLDILLGGGLQDSERQTKTHCQCGCR